LATVTPALKPACATEIDIVGRSSLKSAGEKLTPWATVSVKRTSREKSPSPSVATETRDSRSISRPLPPSNNSWLTAGTLLSSWA
jgi:hypothetical protein